MLLDERLRFSDPRTATADGLVAVGGDFSPERFAARLSQRNIPVDRCADFLVVARPARDFELDQFHVSRSLEKFLRKNPYAITIDRAFRQ